MGRTPTETSHGSRSTSESKQYRRCLLFTLIVSHQADESTSGNKKDNVTIIYTPWANIKVRLRLIPGVGRS